MEENELKLCRKREPVEWTQIERERHLLLLLILLLWVKNKQAVEKARHMIYVFPTWAICLIILHGVLGDFTIMKRWTSYIWGLPWLCFYHKRAYFLAPDCPGKVQGSPGGIFRDHIVLSLAQAVRVEFSETSVAISSSQLNDSSPFFFFWSANDSPTWKLIHRAP